MTRPRAVALALLAVVALAAAAAPAGAVTIARGPGIQAFDSRQGAVAYVVERRGKLTLRVRSASGRTRVVARSKADSSTVLEDFEDLRAGSDAQGATVFVFSRGRGARRALWAVDAAGGSARRLKATDRPRRPESRPSLYAGRLGYFAGRRLVEASLTAGRERRVKLARGNGPVIDAAIGPGFFLVEIQDPFSGEAFDVGFMRDGRYSIFVNTPNGEETSTSVNYMNVLDGRLHVAATSNVESASGVFRAPFTRPRARRERAPFSGEDGASPFGGDVYVRVRRAKGRTISLVTRRLRFAR